LNGSNFVGGNANDPSPVGNQNHGNACAGIIAATGNNGQGISGIAPNVRIMPVRMIGATIANTASSILFAADNGAHVISASWGYESDNPNFIPVIVSAI
jgi:subtilisin family serine protease